MILVKVRLLVQLRIIREPIRNWLQVVNQTEQVGLELTDLKASVLDLVIGLDDVRGSVHRCLLAQAADSLGQRRRQ